MAERDFDIVGSRWCVWQERTCSNLTNPAEGIVLWPQPDRKSKMCCSLTVHVALLLLSKAAVEQCLFQRLHISNNVLCSGLINMEPSVWLVGWQTNSLKHDFFNVTMKQMLTECCAAKCHCFGHMKITHQISEFKHNSKVKQPPYPSKKSDCLSPFWNESYLIKKQWECTDSIP